MNRPLLLAVLLSISSTDAIAQELEVFELSDFVDPRLLVVETESGTTDQASFFTTRISAGLVDHYQRRNEIADSGAHFARLATGLYFRRNQIGVKLTGLDPWSSEYKDVGDVRLQFGRYFMSEDPLGNEIPSRALLSLRSSDSTGSGERDYEVSLALDLELPVKDRKVIGGYVYSYVPEHGDHYLSYVYRATASKWTVVDRELRVDVGLGFGGEQISGDTRWGHSRLELSLVRTLPRFLEGSSIHLVFAPYYHPHPPPGRESFGQEIGFFVDSAIFSRLMYPSRPLGP